MMATLFPREYDFYPRSFLLPAEQKKFRRHFSPSTTYIAKPNVGSLGRGIRLSMSLPEVEAWAEEARVAQSQPSIEKGITVQVYVPDPMLLDGCKFDFRIYILVQSLFPLRVHVYREGLARLCCQSYQAPAPENLSALHMHLTNYSFNKDHVAFVDDSIPFSRT